MTTIRRVPPGRAGRLWLHHRLLVAERGADLLDRKLRILHAERQRLDLLVERTDSAWTDASRSADTWFLRGALVGGQRAVRLAAAAAPADVRITWAQSMGVRYPADVACTVPERLPDSVPPGNTALVEAVKAARRALDAATQHAVATAAARVVESEEAATRRRLRAIERRWIPRLLEALSAVEVGLEEQEHADGVRLRWVVARTGRKPLP
jgi:V/A-type H+-transporting ATPase subunit D